MGNAAKVFEIPPSDYQKLHSLVNDLLHWTIRCSSLCRVFQHVWSVNLKFLPEETFQSKEVAVFLLVGHLGLLWLFAQKRWCKDNGGVIQLAKRFWILGGEVCPAWL